MRRFGLIGHPLGHSFSKTYFESKFEELGLTDHSYDLFDCPNFLEVQSILADVTISGINVTIPYKTQIIPSLSNLSDAARTIGAVNCLVRDKAGWTGHNTDAPAFQASLEPMLNGNAPRALILGTGGSSKAVAHALKNLSIEFDLVSRSKADRILSYDDLDADRLSEYGLVVNCTPAGMHPNTEDAPPILPECLHGDLIVFDLIYNPAETKLLRLAKEKGARTMSGLDMLHKQAELGWEIWNSNT